MRASFTRQNFFPRLWIKSQALLVAAIDRCQQSPAFCNWLEKFAPYLPQFHPLPSPQQHSPQPDQLALCRQRLQKMLHQNILPFWYPQILDNLHGGYRPHHNAQSIWKGPTYKATVTQARLVWFFSYLVNQGFGIEPYLAAAQHGVTFLRQQLWDKQYGGFYWATDMTGKQPLMPNKHTYAQSFALYALIEYALASGDDEVRHFAGTFFHLLDQKTHDSKHGGYHEIFTRNWQPPPLASMNYLDQRPSPKSQNITLHLLEALTPYYQQTQDPLAHNRLLELLLILSNTILQKKAGSCTNYHTQSWHPCTDPMSAVRFGLDLETIWLMIEVVQLLGLSQSIFLDFYQTLFTNCWQHGFDFQQGGFYYAAPLGQPATDKRKEEWVQAEGLVCTLKMYQLTRQEHYWDCFYQTLNWAYQRQTDWANGGWHTRLLEDGTVVGDKAGPLRAGYHINRALISCHKILQKENG